MMKLSQTLKTLLIPALAMLAIGAFSLVSEAATINRTVAVRRVDKVMSDGAVVTFWAFVDANGMGGMGMGGANDFEPGPEIEVGVYPAGSGLSDTLNLSLDMAMAPQEPRPYQGHTIHMHGTDVDMANDGVPDTTGACVRGTCTYSWTPTPDQAGTDVYHCHVHTVKHLEMGMYGALIGRPKNMAGDFLNQLTHDAATAYDYVQVYALGAVDPAYHTAIGDSTVFADYNPQYFLISGNEGKTTAAPAITLAAAGNSKVALRLIGTHSLNSTFRIKDASGRAKPFTVYVVDGIAVPSAQTVTSLDISPGQHYDLIFTTPAAAGTWYPQIAYKSLRNGSLIATVYGRVTF